MDTPVSLKQLVVFMNVVSSGGISEAAKKLHLSASAVSKSVAILEDHLGVQLLQRTTRSLVLTQPGGDLYEKMGGVLADLKATLDSVKSTAAQPSGVLRVTCSLSFGVSQLGQILAEYQSRNPEVEFKLDLSDRPENLNEGHFDLAVRIADAPPDNYVAKRLGPVRYVYCASPDYLEGHGTPGEIGALRDHRCLVYPGLSASWVYTDASGTRRTVEPRKVAIRANSSLVLLEAAVRGQGVAHLPTYLAGRHIANGELRPLFDTHLQEGPRHLYALHLPSRNRNPGLRAFIDFLHGWMNPIVPWEEWGEADTATGRA